MFQLSDFYDYCENNDVEVVLFDRLPAKAVTVRFHGCMSVGLNPTQLTTVRRIRGAAYHESGHLHTGCLHKVSSPFQLVEQMEYRANADSARRYLPVEELRAAMRAGYADPWQLAEYFDLPEDDIKKALHYWTECRGVDFNLAS